MHYYEVAPNQIIRSSSSVFTYASTTRLSVGHIVEIEVGKKPRIGIVITEVPKPAFPTKEILHIIEEQPLPKELITTAVWMSGYYATPLATVLQTVLPRGIQKARRERQPTIRSAIRERTHILLNDEQTKAVEKVESMSPGSAILHGVTGSGKTQVYIELTAKAIARGQSAIILVPEIALTSQLVDEFAHYFPNTILTHSKQTEAERHLTWQIVLRSKEPLVIIGPRSALFLPVASVGLIAIDEAHEPSFKQEQSPRYSALRAATVLGRQHGAKVLFGSATPSISDYFLAEHSKRPIITLTSQARKGTVKSTVSLIDMTKRANFKKHRFFSDKLLSAIEESVSSGKQALLFHNRRGSASTTLCENCGWIASCPRCIVPYTLHGDTHTLRCHICDSTEKVPTQCPVCGAVNIIHKGIGTKLIESELRKLFPNKKIARFDADTGSEATLEKSYKELYDGSINIIIGTQVVAKGLDLPHLRIVGVVQADAGLVLPDYSSSERTFQLLAQVVGRVGRSHHPTKVIVQSYQPTHPAVLDGLSQNYRHLYDATLPIRKAGFFPPFTYLLKLTCVYKTEAAAIKNAKLVANELRKKPAIQILGPTPAFYEQQAGTFRWQLVIKSQTRSSLVEIVKELPQNHWQFELDPISLL
jgi:primosomal protein N' (replication factor Y)